MRQMSLHLLKDVVQCFALLHQFNELRGVCKNTKKKIISVYFTSIYCEKEEKQASIAMLAASCVLS